MLDEGFMQMLSDRLGDDVALASPYPRKIAAGEPLLCVVEDAAIYMTLPPMLVKNLPDTVITGIEKDVDVTFFSPPTFSMPAFFMRGKAEVKRAQLRQGGHGSIIETIVPDPGLHYAEAEKSLVESAAAQGIRQTQANIEINGAPAKKKDRGLVSFPGKRARARTRRDTI